MKNIYECYNVEATSEFQILDKDHMRGTILWMAPESGVHDVTEIICDYAMHYLHFMFIPPDCELQGLLWQKSVGAKQPPNSMGQVGINTILAEPYEYGMCVRL